MEALKSLFSCERRAKQPSVVIGEVISPDWPSELSLYDTVKFCGGPSPGGEKGRWASIESLRMLDTSSEDGFDRITKMMTKIFQTPVSLITLVAEPERVWFKSCVGPFGSCVDRDGSWCNYVLVPPTPEVLITEDASKDARFAHNPYVAGDPFIKFYAGAPLVGSRGERYGTLCIVDLKARAFTAELYSLLINFAALATEEIERNKPLYKCATAAAVNDVERNRHLDMSLMAARDGIAMVDVRSGGWPLVFTNPAFDQSAGLSDKASGQDGFWDRFEPVAASREEIAEAMGRSDCFETGFKCKASKKLLHFRFLPATSDRLAPSKATGIPGWVPSEDAPKGCKLGLDVANDEVVDITERDKKAVPDTKCFWFVVVIGGGSAGNSTAASTGTSSSRHGVSKESSGYGFDSGFCEYHAPSELGSCGKLVLGPLLGSGSYGKVYRSTSNGTTAVAVKVIDCRGRSSVIAAEQLAEAELSCTFDHPRIVKVLAHGLTDEPLEDGSSRQVLWIVQELCDLGTLTNAAECGWLRYERSIKAKPDMSIVLPLLEDIASAMVYLHERSVIHADLTGRNVLLASSDERSFGYIAKVADFGKARIATDGEAQVLDKLGTITHMPPEMMTENLLFPATDVWSFGIISWETLHGKRAYCGRSVPQIIVAVANRHPIEWPPETEQGFLDLMGKVLTFNHEDRPKFPEVLRGLQALR